MSETETDLDSHLIFTRLVEEAVECRLCPALADRRAVLSQRNGTLRPSVLFVAEAPGRQGADRTRIPFYGDASGMAFETLLASVGLTRQEIFITNAVLCSPRSVTGANRSPTRAEVRNCSRFLERTIALLDPPLVVTLGVTALAACGWIEPHGLRLAESVGMGTPWLGRTIVPMYHPSPQVLISVRPMEEQRRDWQALREVMSRLAPRSDESERQCVAASRS